MNSYFLKNCFFSFSWQSYYHNSENNSDSSEIKQINEKLSSLNLDEEKFIELNSLLKSDNKMNKINEYESKYPFLIEKYLKAKSCQVLFFYFETNRIFYFKCLNYFFFTKGKIFDV